jgi:hypothetical protein
MSISFIVDECIAKTFSTPNEPIFLLTVIVFSSADLPAVFITSPLNL